MKISSWLGKKDFESLLQSDEAKLIVFAAKWCGYCKMFLEMAAGFKASSESQLYLVDADDPDESLWDIYNVKLVPSLFVFKSGKPLMRKDAMSGVGLRSSDLEAALTFLAKSS